MQPRAKVVCISFLVTGVPCNVACYLSFLPHAICEISFTVMKMRTKQGANKCRRNLAALIFTDSTNHILYPDRESVLLLQVNATIDISFSHYFGLVTCKVIGCLIHFPCTPSLDNRQTSRTCFELFRRCSNQNVTLSTTSCVLQHFRSIYLIHTT